MGALVTKALRPIKSFNIENRAHRVISKEKPVAAPKYESNIKDLHRTLESDPHLDEKLDKKDPGLDDRLRNIYVTSEGQPEDDITKAMRNPDRPLPQNKRAVIEYEYGFKEPENISYGRTTLRHALNFIASHQANPQVASVSKIASEYKLKEDDVQTILKYYKTFEVYVPETKTSPAVFAGPANFRKLSIKDKIQIDDAKQESPISVQSIKEKS